MTITTAAFVELSVQGPLLSASTQYVLRDLTLVVTLASNMRFSQILSPIRTALIRISTPVASRVPLLYIAGRLHNWARGHQPPIKYMTAVSRYPTITQLITASTYMPLSAELTLLRLIPRSLTSPAYGLEGSPMGATLGERQTCA